jgi:hypothetical protein
MVFGVLMVLSAAVERAGRADAELYTAIYVECAFVAWYAMCYVWVLKTVGFVLFSQESGEPPGF